jgi:hypothetical protein
MMGTTAIVNIALGILNTILGFIAQIKSQGGLTDDQILAEAQTVTASNDAAYAALKQALTGAGIVSQMANPPAPAAKPPVK